MKMHRCLSLLSLCVIAFGVLAMRGSASAKAQALDPWAGIGTSLSPEFTVRDRAVFADRLGLDESQQESLDEFLRAYDEAFVAGRSEVEKAMRAVAPRLSAGTSSAGEAAARLEAEIESKMTELQAALAAAPDDAARERILSEHREDVARLREAVADFGPETMPPEVSAALGEMTAIVRTWQRERARLGEVLLSSVQGMLTEEQLARWPELRRSMRRSRSLGSGVLSGESTDLLFLLDRLVIDPERREGVAAAAQSLSIRLDEVLRARDELVSSPLTPVDEPASEEARIAGIRALAAAHARVRDVNLEYLPILESALGEASAAELRRAFEEHAFVRIARRSRVGRLFSYAAQRPDLTDEERRMIAQLQERYEEELAERRLGLRGILIAQEPEEWAEKWRRQQGLTGPTPAADAIRAALSAHGAWEQNVADELNAILGDERYRALPGSPGAGIRRDGSAAGAPPRSEQLRISEITDPQQRALMERFDADRDGWLSAGERASMLEHVRRGGGA